MPYKTKYFLNALFHFFFFRYFEFWIPGYCKRNAFIKLNLSPYLHLKRNTENYIKYIDFYTNKISQSWQIHYKQLLSSSPPYNSSYICVCIRASSPQRVNLPSPHFHPVHQMNEQFTLFFFFLIPSGVWPISCGHNGCRFQSIPLIPVLQRASNTKVHRDSF